jgi:hypothetical protein
MRAEAIEPSKNEALTPSKSLFDSWWILPAVFLYALNALWFWILGESVYERVQYGTAETGWGLLGGILVLGLPELILTLFTVISLIFLKSRKERIFVGVSLLLVLLVIVGLFGFDLIALLFGAHADGSPTVVLR